MKIKIIFILFISLISRLSQAHEICLTFDDLPTQQNEDPKEQLEINRGILNNLAEFNAPAIGFVNEGKIHLKDREIIGTKILQMWIDNDHTLGNHTYSHFSLSSTDLEIFKDDTLKGEVITKKLMNKAGLSLKYFRHPFLDTGDSKEKKEAFEFFLKSKNYIIAPITVDVDDWTFDRKLLDNPQNKDNIIKKYIAHAKMQLAFSELISRKLFNRNIKHILLLHVNLINSLALKDLLKMMKNENYNFISLDEALNDEAYSTQDNYYEPNGANWLFRWRYTMNKDIDFKKEWADIKAKSTN